MPIGLLLLFLLLFLPMGYVLALGWPRPLAFGCCFDVVPICKLSGCWFTLLVFLTVMPYLFPIGGLLAAHRFLAF